LASFAGETTLSADGASLVTEPQNAKYLEIPGASQAIGRFELASYWNFMHELS
jgi:hypothetical protein